MNNNLRVLVAVLLFSLAAQAAIAQSWSKSQEVDDNFYAIRQQFLDYWADKKPGPGQGYSVFRRWEWYWQTRILPDGSFPPADIKRTEMQKYFSVHPQAEGITAANWTSKGPNLTGTGVDNLGRVNAIAIDPENSNRIWVGSPSGGLWRSDNGGASWSTNTDDFTVMGVSAIVINPTNTNIMYIGTGDGFASGYRSTGVLKSTDGGATWNTTGLTWNVAINNNYIRYMAIHPANPDIVLVASSLGVYRTTDGGATWSRVLTGDYYDVKLKPDEPDVAYAASVNRIYKTTNAGANWTSVHYIPGSDRMAIAVTPADPNRVAAVSSSGASGAFGSFKGLYVSVDAGASFELRSSTPNILNGSEDGTGVDGQGWYDLCIAVSPTNPNLIFVGAINIWVSGDGGVTWSLATFQNNNGPPGVPVIHADKHAFTWDGNTLYLGCDGGIYKTANNGLSWTGLTDGLVISQMYRLGVSQSSEHVLTGLQDNGTKMRNNAGNWTDEIGGDGMECFIHPTNANLMFGEFQYGNIRRSTNGGASWSNIRDNVPWQEDGAWIAPFIIDPTPPNPIYVGFRDVYKSTNQGSTWTAVSSGLSSSNLQYIAVAPSSPNTIYASNGTSVYRTTNGGANWGTVSGMNTITYLSVDPDDANTVYITRGGYTDGQKVFMSVNGGVTWTNISGTLPNLPANCVIVQPQSNGVLYLGMDVGVYRYDPNTGSDWVLFNTGLPNVEVLELEIRHSAGKILAATYGRGLWESDLEPVVVPCTAPQALAATDIQPRSVVLNWSENPDAVSYTVEWRKSGSSTWASVPDISGPSLNTIYLTPCTGYDYRVQAVCANGPSVFSNTGIFSTTGCSNYCSSYGQDPVPNPEPAEWIAGVQLGDINNASGNDWGYNDYTSLSSLLLRDSSYAITLTPGFSGPALDEAWAVWIDWNRDNDFADPGEQVLLQPASPDTISGSFTVPASAVAGKTRMRVSMKAASAPAPCDAPYTSGETEDYLVNVQALPPSLVATPNHLGFPSAGGTLPVDLNTTCAWTVTDVPSWLTVKPLFGPAGMVSFNVTANLNSSIDSLAGTLTITGCDGAIVQYVTVGQSASPVVFSASPVKFTVDYPEDCVEVVLTTNTSWTASTSADWIAFVDPPGGAGNDTLLICYYENTDTVARSATIVVFPAGADSVVVQLFQQAKTSGVYTGTSPTGNQVFCRPNPARESTVFVIESASPQTAQLEVYASDGRMVHAMRDLSLRAGENSFPWQTHGLPAGAYTFKCLFENESVSGRVVLVR